MGIFEKQNSMMENFGIWGTMDKSDKNDYPANVKTDVSRNLWTKKFCNANF